MAIADRDDVVVKHAAIDSLHKKGVSLIISVDCGITAAEEAKYARLIGVDLIITDHHECREQTIPDAIAVIDPKQDDCRYTNKDLAGVGVALKLVCAVEGKNEPIVERYADLAAIGTVADVVPLTGENRYIVRRGLELLGNPSRPGLAALLRESGASEKKISSSTIGFSLAPRLNAAGRLGEVSVAGKLLMTHDAKEASTLAGELCELNRRRQHLETEIWDDASGMMDGKTPSTPIVLASEKWHQGVIGIAASRLAEQYSLPAIIICLNGENGKGSCRSYGGFNLFEALSACSENLTGFGGHALAAGLNIRRDRLDRFREALAAYYRRHRPAPLPEVCCDLLITDPSLLSVENVRSLDMLEPYGNANQKPIMCICGATLESASEVGGGKHLRMRVRLGASHFECIFFSHTARQLGISEGDAVDLAFTPQINEFRGNVTVQLVTAAVRRHDPTALCSAILAGDESVNWAAAAYCPGRADFVRVWRAMDKDFAVGKDAADVIHQCIAGMPPEKFCLCLMVLRETGLLRSEDGGIYSSRCASISGKADLESTHLIRALRALA